MKRIIFLLTNVLTFVACNNIYDNDILITKHSESERISTTRSMTESTSLEQDIATMLELGLDTTNLLIRENYYIADGICVPKSVLSKERNPSDTQNRMSQDTSIHRHYHRIYYKLPFQSGMLYESTIAAINKWDYIDSGLMVDGGYHSRYDNSFFEINLYVEGTCDTDPLVFTVYESDNNHPYTAVIINTLNPLWQVALNNDQYMYLVMHAIGESLKFDSIDTYDGNDRSIMMSEDLLESYPDLWCDFTANDLVAIANAFPKQDEPQFTYQWSPDVEITYEQICLLTEGINYTLTISSNATCCTSSTGTAFGIEIKRSDSTSTNGIVFTKVDGTGNKFNVRIDNEGQYVLTAWVKDGNNVSGLHQQTIELSVLGGVEEFVFNAPDTMKLRTPYKVNYVHTAHPTRTVEYSIREIMFDNGSGENAILLQTGDSCTVILNKYGCYILNAIVKENEQAVDTTYINMTKMLKFPDRDRMTITLDESTATYPDAVVTNVDTLSSYSYSLSMPLTFYNNRFACCVESEYESRNNFSEERRIDRKWFLKLNLLQIYDSPSPFDFNISTVIQLPTLYKIANTEPTIEGFSRWRYEYYTGRLYMPIDGMRMVNGNRILNQPLGYIDIQTEGFTPTRVGFGFEK